VFFRDVLVHIKETAFSRSDFPVILSFENHCSKANQLKMATYCMEVFGGMLLTKPLDDHPLEPGVPLPSPNRLRRKVLIKNKRLESGVERWQMEQFLREGRLPGDGEESPDMAAGSHTSATSIHPLLSSLVNYTQAVKFGGFAKARSNDLHFHMSSFTETAGLRHPTAEFVNYNRRQLSRIYPDGTRVNSSNYSPQVGPIPESRSCQNLSAGTKQGWNPNSTPKQPHF
jgi:phosphatidylinositol phospholipase C, beta